MSHTLWLLWMCVLVVCGLYQALIAILAGSRVQNSTTARQTRSAATPAQPRARKDVMQQWRENLPTDAAEIHAKLEAIRATRPAREQLVEEYREATKPAERRLLRDEINELDEQEYDAWMRSL